MTFGVKPVTQVDESYARFTEPLDALDACRRASIALELRKDSSAGALKHGSDHSDSLRSFEALEAKVAPEGNPEANSLRPLEAFVRGIRAEQPLFVRGTRSESPGWVFERDELSQSPSVVADHDKDVDTLTAVSGKGSLSPKPCRVNVGGRSQKASSSGVWADKKKSTANTMQPSSVSPLGKPCRVSQRDRSEQVTSSGGRANRNCSPITSPRSSVFPSGKPPCPVSPSGPRSSVSSLSRPSPRTSPSGSFTQCAALVRRQLSTALDTKTTTPRTAKSESLQGTGLGASCSRPAAVRAPGHKGSSPRFPSKIAQPSLHCPTHIAQLKVTKPRGTGLQPSQRAGTPRNAPKAGSAKRQLQCNSGQPSCTSRSAASTADGLGRPTSSPPVQPCQRASGPRNKPKVPIDERLQCGTGQRSTPRSTVPTTVVSVNRKVRSAAAQPGQSARQQRADNSFIPHSTASLAPAVAVHRQESPPVEILTRSQAPQGAFIAEIRNAPRKEIAHSSSTVVRMRSQGLHQKSCCFRASCPDGHELQSFPALDDFPCHGCHKKVACGATLWVCQPCVYNVCRECWQTATISPVQARPAPAIF